jgi:pimeloyl-ACP methyl ester carboxylesterase
MPYVEAGGYKTWYEDDNFSDPWTTPETIIIQHGFGRTSQVWYHWVPILGRHYRVIRRDLRGHGRSDAAPGLSWSFAGLVEDLKLFCDALGLGRVHLLAESTGGMLATGFAHRYPERLASLVLCASPTTINHEGQRFFAGNHANWQEALRSLGARGWAEWLVAQAGTSSSNGAQRTWLIDQFGMAETEALVEYSRIISTTDTASLLLTLQTPTLILAPTRSAATSREEQWAIARAIPHSQLVEVAGRGHEIYDDQADACIAAVVAFLRQNVARDHCSRE